jgi:aspartate aminotransferase
MKLSPAIFIGKNGKGTISFGSGQPDLPPPQEIFDILPQCRSFKYGLIQGEEELRAGLAAEFEDADADNFVVTNGASEALDLALRVIGRGGGKILIHKPYYYSYPYLAKFNDLDPVYTETVDGKIDLEDFKDKIRFCKAILINSPGNPTGRIQEIETLREIERICKQLGVIIISDEVYKDLIYERENYMLSGDTVVTVNSFSKTFSMCGYRVGYLYSNDKEFVRSVIDIKTHTSMNTSIIGQQMAAEALKAPRSFVDGQVAVWRERRQLIYEGLKEMGLDVWRPEGAFYVLPAVPEPEKTVIELYQKHKVITYLGDWFGAPGRIRLSYALDKEKIVQGLKIIKDYLGR